MANLSQFWPIDADSGQSRLAVPYVMGPNTRGKKNQIKMDSDSEDDLARETGLDEDYVDEGMEDEANESEDLPKPTPKGRRPRAKSTSRHRATKKAKAAEDPERSTATRDLMTFKPNKDVKQIFS
jgi:hypothetical protein